MGITGKVKTTRIIVEQEKGYFYGIHLTLSTSGIGIDLGVTEPPHLDTPNPLIFIPWEDIDKFRRMLSG